MTPQESQQALGQLQALYNLTRRAPLTADEHDAAREIAQALAQRLRPAPLPQDVEKVAESFAPPNAERPVRTVDGPVTQPS